MVLSFRESSGQLHAILGGKVLRLGLTTVLIIHQSKVYNILATST